MPRPSNTSSVVSAAPARNLRSSKKAAAGAQPDIPSKPKPRKHQVKSAVFVADSPMPPKSEDAQSRQVSSSFTHFPCVMLTYPEHRRHSPKTGVSVMPNTLPLMGRALPPSTEGLKPAPALMTITAGSRVNSVPVPAAPQTEVHDAAQYSSAGASASTERTNGHSYRTKSVPSPHERGSEDSMPEAPPLNAYPDGFGHSDPISEPATAQSVVEELHPGQSIEGSTNTTVSVSHLPFTPASI